MRALTDPDKEGDFSIGTGGERPHDLGPPGGPRRSRGAANSGGQPGAEHAQMAV